MKHKRKAASVTMESPHEIARYTTLIWDPRKCLLTIPRCLDDQTVLLKSVEHDEASLSFTPFCVETNIDCDGVVQFTVLANHGVNHDDTR